MSKPNDPTQTRYKPLADHLANLGGKPITITLSDIEEILGNPLPDTARGNRRQQWWGNDLTHTQATNGWMKAGYSTVNAAETLPDTIHFVHTAGSTTLVGKAPTFKFTREDFASTTHQEEHAKYRHARFKELFVALYDTLGPSFAGPDRKLVGLKQDEPGWPGWKVVNKNTGDVFYRGYVSHPYDRGNQEWKDHSWLGIYFGTERQDTVQFQVDLAKEWSKMLTPLSASVHLTHSAENARKACAKVMGEQKGECLAILKELPKDYFLSVKPENKPAQRKEWLLSKLEGSDMDVIVDALHKDETEFTVGKTFPEAEAISLGTKISGKISESFGLLQPLRTFLVQGNNLTARSVIEHDMATPKLPRDLYKELEKSLLNKQQIIFYGPPGTGKTWTALAFAHEFTYRECIKSVTFHPSYTYEDFVEGIRPKLPKQKEGEEHGAEPVAPGAVAEHARNQTNVSFPYFVEGHAQTGAGHGESGERYEMVPGIFRKIVEEALEAYNADGKNARDFVLLIDEINRGNIPKIFGELITLLEKDYRNEDHKVNLAYTQDEFHVPPNLFIVGTMNTADMSLVQVDTALRRRFAWREMMPDHTNNKIKPEYGKILEQINKNIIKIRSDLRDKQIGHTYFMDIKNPKQLQQAFKDEIIPLLQDYFYHDYDELAKVLNAKRTPPIPKREQIIHADELKVNAELLKETNATQFYNSLKMLP